MISYLSLISPTRLREFNEAVQFARHMGFVICILYGRKYHRSDFSSNLLDIGVMKE